MTDKPALDIWFDFASTYSYPAVMRAPRLAVDAGVALRLRPFLLGPIFKAQGWDTSPFNIYPAKGRYMWRDLARLCDELGLPLVHPDPFPQMSLAAARIATAGMDESWHDDFCRAVFAAEFGSGRDISEREVLAEILNGLGVDPESTLERATTPAVKQRLRAETEEAQRLGIFGAPTLIASDGELFWGNDRLEAALRWAARGR